ncbi:MAG: Nif3-like dinuclear metal center hexameric protein [Betaproteobacteria bacterium]|nr:Nif3-like dinuclear metal center hexameric protein [Betaproteobacteria bacterium]
MKFAGTVDRDALAKYLDEYLSVTMFKDYCPNGLQVEGRARIGRLVTGVTASAALLDAAIAWQADAVLVHHGYFWRGEDARLLGVKRHRIARLIHADMNLFAFHLPLDVHPEVGNNALLGRRLGWTIDTRCGDQNLIAISTLAVPISFAELGRRVEARLARPPLLIGDADRQVARVAWCTGGAQGLFADAIAAGVDAYLTGEVSEQHFHLATESGVGFIAAGHHATERFGIEALGERLAREFGLDHRFIDIPNPV